MPPEETEMEQPGPDPEDVCAGRGVDLADLEVETEGGLTLRLVEAEPDEQIVGDNAWTVELQEDGEPLAGLAAAIEVTPFMPDHGHGTAVAVEVAEVEPGQYELSPVNLRMPGYWLITIEIQPADDDVDRVQFGVCVE